MSLSPIQAATERTNATIDTTIATSKSLGVATESDSPTNVILAVNESIFRVGDAIGQQLSSTTTATDGAMHNSIRRSACFTPSLSTAALSTLSDDTDTSDEFTSDDGEQHLHRYLPRQRQRQQTSPLQSIFRRPVCGIKRSSPDVSEEENEDDDDEYLSLPMKKRPSLGSIKKANPVGSDDAGFDEPTDEQQQQFDIPSSPGQRIEDTPLSSSSSPYTSLFAASSSTTSPYTSLFAEATTATASREPLIEIAPTHHHLSHPLSNTPTKMKSAHDMIKN